MLYNVKPLVKKLAEAAKLDSGLTIVYCDKKLTHAIRSTGEGGPGYEHEWSAVDARKRRENALKDRIMSEMWLVDEHHLRGETGAGNSVINNEADLVVKFGIQDDGLLYMCVVKARTIHEKMPGFPVRRVVTLIPVTNEIAVANQNDGADIEEGMVIVRPNGFGNINDMRSVVFNRERAVGFVQIPDLGIDWVTETPILATPVVLLRGVCVPLEDHGGVSHQGIPFAYIVRTAPGYARNLLLASAHGDPATIPENVQASGLLQEYAYAVTHNNPEIAWPDYCNYDFGRKQITFTAHYGKGTPVGS